MKREIRQQLHAPAQIHAIAPKLLVIEMNRSLVRRGDPRQTANQRRLSRAVRPEQTHDLPWLDAQRNLVERAHRAVGFQDAVQLNSHLAARNQKSAFGNASSLANDADPGVTQTL